MYIIQYVCKALCKALCKTRCKSSRPKWARRGRGAPMGAPGPLDIVYNNNFASYSMCVQGCVQGFVQGSVQGLLAHRLCKAMPCTLCKAKKLHLT